MQSLSNFDALGNEVTEEVLSQPGRLVNHHQWLLAVHLEVVDTLFVQHFVLCIDDLKAAKYHRLLPPPKGTLEKCEFLLLSIVNYPLNVFASEEMVTPGHHNEQI